MTDRARELLEKIVHWWDDDKEFIGDFVEEIRAYLAEPEVKREVLSDEDIDRELIKNDYYSRSFTAGVRFAEKHHGVTGGWDE